MEPPYETDFRTASSDEKDRIISNIRRRLREQIPQYDDLTVDWNQELDDIFRNTMRQSDPNDVDYEARIVDMIDSIVELYRVRILRNVNNCSPQIVLMPRWEQREVNREDELQRPHESKNLHYNEYLRTCV